MKAGYEYQDHGGEKHYAAVINDDTVRRIWQLRREEGLGWKRIAKRLGLNTWITRKILRGETWKHLLPNDWQDMKTAPVVQTKASHAHHLLKHIRQLIRVRKARLRSIMEQPRIMGDDRGFMGRKILRSRLAVEQAEAWEKMVLELQEKDDVDA